MKNLTQLSFGSCIAFPEFIHSENYSSMSVQARFIYAKMVDLLRASITRLNYDEDGAFIYASSKYFADYFGCSEATINRKIAELKSYGLIERKSQDKFRSAKTYLNVMINGKLVRINQHFSGFESFFLVPVDSMTSMNKATYIYSYMRHTIIQSVNKGTSMSDHTGLFGVFDLTKFASFFSDSLSSISKVIKSLVNSGLILRKQQGNHKQAHTYLTEFLGLSDHTSPVKSDKREYENLTDETCTNCEANNNNSKLNKLSVNIITDDDTLAAKLYKVAKKVNKTRSEAEVEDMIEFVTDRYRDNQIVSPVAYFKSLMKNGLKKVSLSVKKNGYGYLDQYHHDQERIDQLSEIEELLRLSNNC